MKSVCMTRGISGWGTRVTFEIMAGDGNLISGEEIISYIHIWWEGTVVLTFPLPRITVSISKMLLTQRTASLYIRNPSFTITLVCDWNLPLGNLPDAKFLSHSQLLAAHTGKSVLVLHYRPIPMLQTGIYRFYEAQCGQKNVRVCPVIGPSAHCGLYRRNATQFQPETWYI